MFHFGDGEYYVVKFSDNTYYTGGFTVYDNKTTTDIRNARTYQFEWQVHKDLYLAQFLHGKDIECEYVKVRVETNVEVVEEKNEMKISDLINKLEVIKNLHGDLDLYTHVGYGESITRLEGDYCPNPVKLYYPKLNKYNEGWLDELKSDELSTNDTDLRGADLTRPIIKGLII